MSEKVNIGNIEINNSSVVSFLQKLGVARVAAMATVALVMLGFFIYLITKFNEPHLSVLYSDLEFKDSIEIVKKLESQNIPHEIKGDGSVILVPKDQVLKLRLTMAEEGLPMGNSVGYEIFDKSNTLGATNFVQNINHLRAIEGELARTIKALNQVQHARVHLVLPKRKLFARDKAKASASIIIKSRGSLDRGQIRAIQHLVASAVEDLTPGQVSLVDETGHLLASGENQDSPGAMSSEVTQRTQAYEMRLTRELEAIVARIVGNGHVRIRVNAEMDYNRVVKSSEIFDPDGKVVRSSNTREESSKSEQPTSDNSVTVGNDLPDSNVAKGNNGKAIDDKDKTQEVINYEISKTNQTETIEGGRVKRLSVAVLVDGVYNKNADGAVEYAPRQQAELEQIAKLVRSAVGFDEKRGDILNVTNLKFAENPDLKLGEQEEASMFDFTKADYFYIAELFITLLISMFFILFVIRPLVKRVLEPENNDIVIDLVEHLGEANRAEDVPIEINTDKLGSLEDLEGQMVENKTAKTIQEAKISGELQAEAIRQIGTLVKNNPQEATAVIRSWVDSSKAA